MELNLTIEDLVILPELRYFFSSNGDGLEQEILEAGVVRDPLLYGAIGDDYILFDGHRRYEIISRYPDIPYRMEFVGDFANIYEVQLWMVEHQANRRNITLMEAIEYALLFKDEIANRAKQNQIKKGISEPVHTLKELVKIIESWGHEIGDSTVSFAEIVFNSEFDYLIEAIRTGECPISRAKDCVKVLRTAPRVIQHGVESWKLYNPNIIADITEVYNRNNPDLCTIIEDMLQSGILDTSGNPIYISDYAWKILTPDEEYTHDILSSGDFRNGRFELYQAELVDPEERSVPLSTSESSVLSDETPAPAITKAKLILQMDELNDDQVSVLSDFLEIFEISLPESDTVEFNIKAIG